MPVQWMHLASLPLLDDESVNYYVVSEKWRTCQCCLIEMQSQEFHIVSYRGTVIYPVNTSRK